MGSLQAHKIHFILISLFVLLLLFLCGSNHAIKFAEKNCRRLNFLGGRKERCKSWIPPIYGTGKQTLENFGNNSYYKRDHTYTSIQLQHSVSHTFASAFSGI